MAALNEGENQVTGDGLDVLTGADKPLAVRVFGQEQDVLRREAANVQRLMSEVDGVEDPQISQPTAQPELADQGGPGQRPAPRASSPATCAAPKPR